MPSVSDDLVYSLDPVLWSREVLGYHPDPWQADLLKSRSRKIILNCSRQSGKSTTSAVLGLHESILGPYTSRFDKKNNAYKSS